PPEERVPKQIDQAAGALMGRLNAIPGVFAFMRPFPVLQISTGAVNTNQGQYGFAVSGVNPAQVYETAGKLMEKLRAGPEFPKLFGSLSSDYFANTPNLDVEIRRDQAH